MGTEGAIGSTSGVVDGGFKTGAGGSRADARVVASPSIARASHTQMKLNVRVPPSREGRYGRVPDTQDALPSQAGGFAFVTDQKFEDEEDTTVAGFGAGRQAVAEDRKVKAMRRDGVTSS